jgi:hypothetical protein
MRTASIALAMTTPAPPGWCPNHDVSRTGSGGSIYTTSNDNLHITVDSSSPSPDLAAPVPRRHVRILDDAVGKCGSWCGPPLSTPNCISHLFPPFPWQWTSTSWLILMSTTGTGRAAEVPSPSMREWSVHTPFDLFFSASHAVIHMYPLSGTLLVTSVHGCSWLCMWSVCSWIAHSQHAPM